MDEAATIPAPAPRSDECSYCGNERISCDSKKPTPLVQAILDACETNFAGLPEEEK